jgi:hypothetical protein
MLDLIRGLWRKGINLASTPNGREGSRIIHVQHTSATAKPLVPCAIEHLANANLS